MPRDLASKNITKKSRREKTMTMNDTLASALSKINNAENAIKSELIIKPYSKILAKVLDIANHEGYVGKYDIIETPQGKAMKLYLINKINQCGVVKPRYSVALGEYEKFEKRFLLSKGFGILIVSTTKGIMTHKEAVKNRLGGVLLAYFY